MRHFERFDHDCDPVTRDRAPRKESRRRNPYTPFQRVIIFASSQKGGSFGGRARYVTAYADHLYGNSERPQASTFGITEGEAEKLAAAVRRIVPSRDRVHHNPAASRRAETLIYPDGRIVGTFYGRHHTDGKLYKHRFTSAHVSISGLPDGSILIRPRRGRLWRNFKV